MPKPKKKMEVLSETYTVEKKECLQQQATERINGYYQHPITRKQLPSVTTLTKCVGDSAGLLKWFAQQGGKGVIYELAKIKDLDILAERLASPTSLEWAEDRAVVHAMDASKPARDFGSAVHIALEDIVFKGLKDTVPNGCKSHWNDPLFQRVLTTYLDFFNRVTWHIHASEAEVFNEDDKYAGRPDQIVTIKQEDLGGVIPYLTRGTPNPNEKVFNLVVDFKTGSSYPKEHGLQLAGYVPAIEKTLKIPINGGLILGVDRKDPDKLKALWFGIDELREIYNGVFKAAIQAWRYYKAPQWWSKQWDIANY